MRGIPTRDAEAVYEVVRDWPLGFPLSTNELARHAEISPVQVRPILEDLLASDRVLLEICSTFYVVTLRLKGGPVNNRDGLAPRNPRLVLFQARFEPSDYTAMFRVRYRSLRRLIETVVANPGITLGTVDLRAFYAKPNDTHTRYEITTLLEEKVLTRQPVDESRDLYSYTAHAENVPRLLIKLKRHEQRVRGRESYA